MKKPKQPLTNEHLLNDLPNNFSLAEEAINIAYKQLEAGQGFSLQKVLNSVVKSGDMAAPVLEEAKEEETQESE